MNAYKGDCICLPIRSSVCFNSKTAGWILTNDGLDGFYASGRYKKLHSPFDFSKLRYYRSISCFHKAVS
jgi:hypothetical protein